MLRNPDPGDWLMARRNYQGWSYSPLTDITRANVKDLKLAWVWQMNETGANQPMPLVHNGIMYLVNTLNTVQALDARTGALIWENHIGPEQIVGFGSMRNFAIYNDKIITATTDARLVALDARTGKKVWETVIADRAKGFSETSGPIVAKGTIVQGLQGCDRYREDDRCFISGYDADTGKLKWKFYTVAQKRRAGRRHVGHAARRDARGRRNVDRRELRSRSEPHLLGRRAGEAVDAREPRQHGVRRQRSTRRPPSR